MERLRLSVIRDIVSTTPHPYVLHPGMIVAGIHSGFAAGCELVTRRRDNMTFPAGPAATLKRPPQNIRHCKWIPAAAGMKRSAVDAGSIGDTVSQVIRFLTRFLLLEQQYEIHATCVIRGSGFLFFLFLSFYSIFEILFCIFSLSSVSLCCMSFVFYHLSLLFVFTRNPRPETRKGILSMVKPNSFQHTLPRVFYINFFNSRSGRRGRMRRHMRDNMASREERSGKCSSKGSDVWILLPIVSTAHFLELFGSTHFDPFNNKRSPESFAEDFRLPLSSPGVYTNPPFKPTDKFFRPNRQWCGAPRGGGEGSLRARVSIEQQERTCFKPSAMISSVADRQQRGRFSKHRRAACSTARTMGLLEKRHEFHIHEHQQNMGTGNALFQRCLYPFLRPREFFNSPAIPLCKTVRAGGVKGVSRLMSKREMPLHSMVAMPIAAVYRDENSVTF